MPFDPSFPEPEPDLPPSALRRRSGGDPWPSWVIRPGDCRASLATLEPTPDEFVAALVEVFREVRRVLRDDGPKLDPGVSVPVVPCDDAAIERAAKALRRVLDTADLTESREKRAHDLAVAALRAAGETP